MPQDLAGKELTGLQDCLYRELVEVAAAGNVCPTNRALAERCGATAASSVADAFGRLRRKGLLAVVSFGRRGRIVTSTELGLTTAAPTTRRARSSRGASRQNRHEAAQEGSALDDEYSGLETKGGAWVPPWCEAVLRAALPVRRDLGSPRAANPRDWRLQLCQYIPDDPNPDDSCKCCAPVVAGAAYCEKHLRRCALRSSALTSLAAIPRSMSMRDTDAAAG